MVDNLLYSGTVVYRVDELAQLGPIGLTVYSSNSRSFFYDLTQLASK